MQRRRRRQISDARQSGVLFHSSPLQSSRVAALPCQPFNPLHIKCTLEVEHAADADAQTYSRSCKMETYDY